MMFKISQRPREGWPAASELTEFHMEPASGGQDAALRDLGRGG